MALNTYTPQQLLTRVRALPEFLPISDQLPWSKHHESHRDHWIKWLGEYDGPGFYGRSNHNRDAAYVWSHLQCAPMLVYLAEGAGLKAGIVLHARHVAATDPGNRSAVSAATRRLLPWVAVRNGLWPA